MVLISKSWQRHDIHQATIAATETVMIQEKFCTLLNWPWRVKSRWFIDRYTYGLPTYELRPSLLFISMSIWIGTREFLTIDRDNRWTHKYGKSIRASFNLIAFYFFSVFVCFDLLQWRFDKHSDHQATALTRFKPLSIFTRIKVQTSWCITYNTKMLIFYVFSRIIFTLRCWVYLVDFRKLQKFLASGVYR